MQLRMELRILDDNAVVGAHQFIPNWYIGSTLPAVTLSFLAMLSGAEIMRLVALMALRHLSFAYNFSEESTLTVFWNRL